MSSNLDYQVDLLTSMLDASPAAICVVDSKDLRVKWVNRKYREILGEPFNSSDIAGQLLADVFPSLFSSGAWAIYKEVARTHKPFHDPEFRFEELGHGTTYWHWTLTPLQLGTGAPDLMSQAIEVTHLVEARKKIQEQAEQITRDRRIHDTILAATPDYYYLTNPQGELTYVNKALADFLGIPVEQMLGKTFFQIGYPYDIWKRIESSIRMAVKTKQIQKYESYFISPKGEAAYLDRQFVPIVNERKEVELVAGIVHNITDRKRAEERLAESEQRFKLFADSISQLAWMANPDGTVYWYNQKWFDYTGTSLKEMAGWGWKSVHHPKFLPNVLEAWEHSLATGKPFRMVFPLRSKGGRYYQFLTAATPYKNDQGEIKVWFGTCTRVNKSEAGNKKGSHSSLFDAEE
jgi:PAS domain S-box-containing protein